jgi:cytochrome P450
MVYHLLSDRALLAQCRAELEKGSGAGAVPGGGDTITNREGAQGEVLVRVVSLDWIRRECPVLMATLDEVFRFRGVGMPLVRRVLEDHRLGGRWVLRKGGIVLMPTSVLHFDEGVWGRDASEFRPARFLEEHHHGEGGDDGGRLRRMARGLRVFGGGATRCPGRQFVEDQVLAFAALMVLQFDLRPVEAGGGGTWAQPETGSSFRIGLLRAFSMPESDLEVEISARSPEQQCMVLWHESRSKRNGCE